MAKTGNNDKTAADSWYRDGLRFRCTACGNCCTGEPGYVFVTGEEIERIAAFLGRDEQATRDAHTMRVGIRYSLKEDKRTGDCCFLKRSPGGKRTCSIYPVRPLQCRTWPFWNLNLASPEAWKEAASDCPGMNRGKHVDFVEIEVQRTARRLEDLSPCPTRSAT